MLPTLVSIEILLTDSSYNFLGKFEAHETKKPANEERLKPPPRADLKFNMEINTMLNIVA